MIDIHRFSIQPERDTPRRLHEPSAGLYCVYVYHWFTKGWSVETIAEKTGWDVITIEHLLRDYERLYKHGKDTISAV